MLDVWWSVDDRADQFRGTSSSVLHRIEGPVAFALARVDGVAVGCGVGTIRDGLLGLQCFATRPEARGLGVGTAIFDALVAWAAPVTEAIWLQVGIGNHVAKSLYETLGLRGAYRYAYLSPTR
jgi:GNAT superfamily N-acetyltransferase